MQAGNKKRLIIGLVAVCCAFNMIIYVVTPQKEMTWIKHGHVEWQTFKNSRTTLNDQDSPFVNIIWVMDFTSFSQVRTRSPLPLLNWNKTYESLVYLSPSMDPRAEKGLEQMYLSANPFYIYWNKNPEMTFNEALSSFCKANEIKYFIDHSEDFELENIGAMVVDTTFADPYSKSVLLEVSYQ